MIAINHLAAPFELLTFWKYYALKILSLTLAGALILVLVDISGFGSPRIIRGIPRVKEYPIVGNLFQVLKNPAKVYMNWAQQYGVDIFQIRLGIKRVVVVNSYADVDNLWIKNSRANNSRPVSYTFHDVVSITQGFTIGSTPAGQTYQKKKKAISMMLNNKMVEELSSVIDDESVYTIRNILKLNPELSGPPSCNMFRYVRYELADVDLMLYAQLFALRSSIYICYGIKLDCYNKDFELAKEIIEVENHIINFRSPVANLQDYIPILRALPGKGNKAAHWRARRDTYMNHLISLTKSRLNEGDKSAIHSLVGKVLLSDKNNNRLTSNELQSLCLTMVSAGLDNTPLNLNHLMGHLSHPYGERFQEAALNEMLSKNKNDLCLAWDNAVQNMDCNYVTALVKETLRYFTVLPLSLPRVTTKDINYKGALIPKDTILFMNAYAANHDPSRFSDPYDFRPERWLDSNNKILSKQDLNHFSFGAGSRMCSGAQLAFKELYILTSRMILYFKIRPPVSNSIMELDPFKNNSRPGATSFEPYPFKVRLEPRFMSGSDSLYSKIMKCQ